MRKSKWNFKPIQILKMLQINFVNLLKICFCWSIYKMLLAIRVTRFRFLSNNLIIIVFMFTADRLIDQKFPLINNSLPIKKYTGFYLCEWRQEDGFSINLTFTAWLCYLCNVISCTQVQCHYYQWLISCSHC